MQKEVGSKINLLEDYLQHRDPLFDIKGTAIFTGHAKLPSGIALYEFLKVVSCTLIVELKTGRVLDASFTTLTPITNQYIRSIVVDWSMKDGLDVLEKTFNQYCHMSSAKAFLKSIEVACQKYFDFIAK